MALRDELLIQALKDKFPGTYEEAQHDAEKLLPLLQKGEKRLRGIRKIKDGTALQASKGSLTLGSFAITSEEVRSEKEALTLALALRKKGIQVTALVPPETFNRVKDERIAAGEFGSRHERK